MQNRRIMCCIPGTWHDFSTVNITVEEFCLHQKRNLGRYRWRIVPVHGCSTVAGTILHKSMALFINSHWCNSSTDTGTNVQQSLARFFNSGWHDCSTVSGMILQQWLAQLFNSRWHDCSTVTGTIVQQSLTWLFNSHWRDCSTVTHTFPTYQCLQKGVGDFF